MHDVGCNYNKKNQLLTNAYQTNRSFANGSIEKHSIENKKLFIENSKSNKKKPFVSGKYRSQCLRSVNYKLAWLHNHHIPENQNHNNSLFSFFYFAPFFY